MNSQLPKAILALTKASLILWMSLVAFLICLEKLAVGLDESVAIVVGSFVKNILKSKRNFDLRLVVAVDFFI